MYHSVMTPLWPLPPGHQHRDVVPVQEDLVQLGHPPPLAGRLVLGHVLQHHVHEVVEPEQSAHHLLVVLHDDVHPRADGFVHQF